MYEIRKNIKTHAPTWALIEDYQRLKLALQSDDYEELRENVNVTLDCLAELIENNTEIPDGLQIRPSPSTVILADYCGIVTSGGQDVLCAAKQPVSNAMSGGCWQCSEECPYYVNRECEPENGRILLDGGFLYDGSCRNQEALCEFLNVPTEDIAHED